MAQRDYPRPTGSKDTSGLANSANQFHLSQVAVTVQTSQQVVKRLASVSMTTQTSGPTLSLSKMNGKQCYSAQIQN